MLQIRLTGIGVVLYLPQQSKDVIVGACPNPLEDLQGLGLRSHLYKGQKFANLVSFLFENLVSAPKGRPSTLAFLCLILALSTEILTARTSGPNDLRGRW